jgi:fucose permease
MGYPASLGSRRSAQKRFGDKTTVIAGLLLMIVGSCMFAFSSYWIGQIAGRFVSAVGGMLMAVLMTKMVADWFVGKELSTAMAIFVNSWPIGIAASLLVLPPIGVAYGPTAMDLAVAGLIAIATGLHALAYRSPSASTHASRSSGRLGSQAAIAVVIFALPTP